MRTGDEHSCRQESPADEASCTQERLSKLTRPIRMLRRDEVEKVADVCRATIYDLMRKGQFPSSVKLTGGRAVRWIEEEVQEWLANRILGKKLTR